LHLLDLSHDKLAHRQNARPNPSHRCRIIPNWSTLSPSLPADRRMWLASTWLRAEFARLGPLVGGFESVRVFQKKEEEGVSLSCLRRTTPTHQKHPLSVSAGPYHEQRSKEKNLPTSNGPIDIFGLK